MRRGWFVLIMGAVLACLPAAAPAAAVERAKPVGRADRLAAELRRDPVYVTDHAPRALPADAADRIRKAVARLGTPVYVAVTPTSLVERYTAQDLVPLVHDSLNRPGLYIVADPTSTAFSAVQYGGTTLPVKDAMYAATSELPSDAGAVATIERFADIALSGHAAERRENAGPRPKSKIRIELDARDRSEREARRREWGVFAAGTALSGAAVLLLLVGLRRRAATRAERARTARLEKARTKNAQARKARAEKRGKRR
ncbi:hypothetical protein ABZ806_07810 [Spirillospora sp. NPDC047418]